MHTVQYEAFISNTHTHTDTRSMHLLNTHITSHSRALCFLIIIIIGRRHNSMWFCGYGRLHLATHRRGLPEVGGVSGSAQSSIQFGGHSLHLLTAAKCICSCMLYVSVSAAKHDNKKKPKLKQFAVNSWHQNVNYYEHCAGVCVCVTV